MNKIIKIDPIPKYFSVQWMLGSFCNYDCMYCPAEYHDVTSSPHDLQTLQKAWRNIYDKTTHLNLKYKIAFSGGEVTANKNFLPFLRWLRNTYSDIAVVGVATNGSASLNYYKKLSDLVEFISFSTHSEFMDEEKFFKKSLALHKIMVNPQKSFIVNIMDEHWNTERTKIYKQWLDLHKINYTVNEIDYSVQTRIFFVNKGKLNFEKIRES
jgi:MoaA/NifB/PqqE/SkfB family radical SAM enzyme